MEGAEREELCTLLKNNSTRVFGTFRLEFTCILDVRSDLYKRMMIMMIIITTTIIMMQGRDQEHEHACRRINLKHFLL